MTDSTADITRQLCPNGNLMILDILKPDLKEIRDDLAISLRKIRKTDRAMACALLARWRLGVALTERALQDNLYYGAPLVGWRKEENPGK